MKKPSSDTLRNAVVVASSCVISFLLFGTARLAGQLFLACRERFSVGRREAAVPFVLAFTVRNISGPFVGYLGNKLSLLRVTELGCAVSAVSLGACFFVEDIITFTVLWGGCFGTGFGMGTILITNILHVRFKTNFNKMQGIFLASGCIGSFVLPGITEYLLETYGPSGTFLILSGFVFHCIPAVMLLKEPEKSQRIQLEINELEVTNQIGKELKSISIENICNFENRVVTTQQIPQTESNRSGRKNKEVIQCSDLPKDFTAKKPIKLEICCEGSIIQKENYDSEKHSHASDCKKNANAMVTWHRSSYSISRNFQVFLDPAYILILISFSSAMVVVITMYTVIVDACRDKGITEDVTVLMTFAIVDVLGRLMFGLMADGGCISPLNLYALCCGSCGLLMIGFIWLDNFYIILIFIACIGALMGGVLVLAPGVIRDHIKKEDITMAFSSRYVLFGLLNITQPLVIGYFRETLHSYDGLFYLLASMCVLSTIISLLIPSAARLRDRKKKRCG